MRAGEPCPFCGAVAPEAPRASSSLGRSSRAALVVLVAASPGSLLDCHNPAPMGAVYGGPPLAVMDAAPPPAVADAGAPAPDVPDAAAPAPDVSDAAVAAPPARDAAVKPAPPVPYRPPATMYGGPPPWDHPKLKR